MSRRLKTLFYGVTHEHAFGKFETLKRLSDDFEIVGVVDDRPRGTMRFLDQRLDVEQIVRDGFRVLSEERARELTDIDVVVIETANGDLMEIAALYASRGVPMHCDKPCGESLEPYRAILWACKARRLPFQIGYMYRGNPAIQWIGRQVQEGRLGEVRFIEADMNHDYQSDGYEAYIGSFRGGILYNLGCHLVDLVCPFVSGQTLRTVHPFLDGTRAAAYLRFDQTDVMLRASAYLPGGLLARRLRVDGTKGTIDLCPIERFDGKPLSLTWTDKTGVRVQTFGVQTDRYACQLLDLAAVVRGEKPNDQDYDRDFRAHELTLLACGIAE